MVMGAILILSAGLVFLIAASVVVWRIYKRGRSEHQEDSMPPIDARATPSSRRPNRRQAVEEDSTDEETPLRFSDRAFAFSQMMDPEQITFGSLAALAWTTIAFGLFSMWYEDPRLPQKEMPLFLQSGWVYLTLAGVTAIGVFVQGCRKYVAGDLALGDFGLFTLAFAALLPLIWATIPARNESTFTVLSVMAAALVAPPVLLLLAVGWALVQPYLPVRRAEPHRAEPSSVPLVELSGQLGEGLVLVKGRSPSEYAAHAKRLKAALVYLISLPGDSMRRTDFDRVNRILGNRLGEQFWTMGGHVEDGAVLRLGLQQSLTDNLEKCEQMARG